MLDWDEEELASILWDEASDTVVPYHEGNEGSHLADAHKELSKQLSSNELAGIHDWGKESDSGCYSNKEKILSCLGAGPWKDPNFTTAVKQSPDSIGANLVSGAGTTQNLSLSGGKATQTDKESETSQEQLVGHGNGDFVDYRWDDIGSFDELDKIFSNGDPIFRNIVLDGVDEIWSASIDAGYSLDKPFPSPVEPLISCPESLDNARMQNKVRTEHTHQSNQPISDHDSLRDSMRYNCSNTVDLTEAGTNSKLFEERLDRTVKGTELSSPNSSCSTLKTSNKVNKQKKNRKGLDHKMKGKSLLSPYGGHYLPENQLQQFGNRQDATSMVHSYPFSEQTQRNTSQHQSNKLAEIYENMYNQHHIVPIMPQHLNGVGGFQQNCPAYKVSHGSSRLRTIYTPLKPLFMTPQEKIDKLRRRQQLQAMLAIKKKQQKLAHKTSGLDIDHLISKKHCHDNQTEATDGNEKDIGETLSIHPYSDPCCSSQKEIPSNISKAVNEFPAENSALSQLQDIISKLDSRVRLCIRDSLFRLATSAAQRHYPSDDLSANINLRDEDYKLTKDEISNHNRSAALVDVETETNPTDRTVAHLLFHRPFDVIGKQSKTLNLSLSTQPLPGAKIESLFGVPTEYSKDNAELKHSFLPQKESDNFFPAIEPQLGSEFLDSACMDVHEKTSSHEPGTDEPSKQIL